MIMLVLWRSVLAFVIYTIHFVDYSFESNRRIVFVNLERPRVTYENPKYIKILNLTSRRLSRQDPMHYAECCAQYYVDFDNNIVIWLKIDEWLSNEYRPTFVRINFKLCEFFKFMKIKVFKSKDVAIPATHYEPDFKNCHVESGVYCIHNVSVPVARLPQVFPFEKGRVHFNVTYKGRELIVKGYFDLDVKMMPVVKSKNKD